MPVAANQAAFARRGDEHPPWSAAWWEEARRGPEWWRGLPRPVRIGLVVLGFIAWWPLGLALLGFAIWSRSMGCFSRGARGWRVAEQAGGSPGCGSVRASSGNLAFDEYRAETLRRLEHEQQAFGAFLERLRVAKDKAEFDQFMADRRTSPPPAEPPREAG